MMRFMTRKLAAIRDEIDSWGMRLPTASRVREPMIRVFLDRAHEGKQDILVGILSQEEGDFVFRYDPGYGQLPGVRPISAFPELLKEYREKVLWPFFAARIPPLDREDVRAEIAKSHLQPNDTIRMLGTLSTKTITNPYRFELAAAA
jgi:HipA-like protein